MACFLLQRPIAGKFAQLKKIKTINQFLKYLFVVVLLSSCSTVKNAFQPKNTAEATAPKQSQLIEHIEIKPETTANARNTGSGKNQKQVFQTREVVNKYSSLEIFSPLQFKYAIKLDVPVEKLQNKNLYTIIEDWWGTPYRMGGTSLKGIDCSAFVQTLMLGVFSLSLPRTAREQYVLSESVSMFDLKEGDLVFFNTRGGVSHVGVYLQNNKFVHASTSGGVMISDLNDNYWGRKLIGAGRVLQSIIPRP